MDERLGRAIESLRELPRVRAEATARLLIAVAADRQRQREAAISRTRSRKQWLAWGAVATAAAVIGTLSQLSSVPRTEARADAPISNAMTASVVLPASRGADNADAPRPVQLVLSAPGARSVRVVGDFNGWDDRRSPMVRDDASGLWNVTLALRPGRHVYAFVVNDTQWVRDPRATAAPDADFGRPGSVLLVGRP